MTQPKTKVSSIAIVEQDSKILLVQEDKPDHFLHWGLPGGTVEGNETWESCAVREVREETGLLVMAKHLVHIYQNTNSDSGNNNTTFVYAAEPYGGELIAGDGHPMALFYAYSEIEMMHDSYELRSPMVIDAIKHYLNGATVPPETYSTLPIQPR